MRITFDPQIFLRQRGGGISRLFVDLILGLDSAPDVHVTLPFRWVSNEYAGDVLADKGLRVTPNWVPRQVLYAPWALRGMPRAVQADIVHHTYYSSRFLADIGEARRVTTVHDMIPERFSGTVDFTRSHLAKRDYVMRSDLIVCVSEATRLDLLEFFGETPAPVVVIPNAVSSLFRPELPRVPGLPAEYLLYVGKRKGYKAFSILPKAIALLRENGLEVPVVAVGAQFNVSEEDGLRRLGVRDLFRQVALSDALLRRAYANCRLLVQTSNCEGFGMTPLEAMASGAPVVIANASAMPEVGGDVARYFEPGEVASLAAAIEELLIDDSLRADLARRGIERAGQFSTERMAAQTAHAYRSLLGKA